MKRNTSTSGIVCGVLATTGILAAICALGTGLDRTNNKLEEISAQLEKMAPIYGAQTGDVAGGRGEERYFFVHGENGPEITFTHYDGKPLSEFAKPLDEYKKVTPE